MAPWFVPLVGDLPPQFQHLSLVQAALESIRPVPLGPDQDVSGEPLFDLPLSGWYWQVTRLDRPKPEVISSRSLWDRGLPYLTDTGTTAALRMV